MSASLRYLARTVVTRRFIWSSPIGSSSTKFSIRSFATTYYTPAHEYVKVEGEVGTIGITDYAQSALGDIVFVDLPSEDDTLEKGDSFGSVESVKAASDVYAPVSGTVIEVNDKLSDEPGLVNSSAEEDAWFIKVKIANANELKELLDEKAYKIHCEKESH